MKVLRISLPAVVVCLALALYAEPNDNARVEVLAKTSKMWDGSPLPDYPKENPEVTILKVTIPAHTELPMHKHAVINAGYVLSGELTVVSEEGPEMTLKAGDTLVELVDKWHYGKNEGDEDVEIVVFYAGEKDKPITIKK
ncbi:MAG: cupin domain-containing protein [Candidatus Omnitrophica bacterium]|nr:cupin domain-containing protein [Candidatus Omnitrophota bacterium]MCA9415694.1 cupin domain-containing protein [Candidatus Omnitrophota bacterium]MCA9426965.1 cupin domain-containing protein [Candidatus Omnitrophota bacterium]MCA9429921.1 cupin domain-containing protein [Candidatus Omnitrophota bacterium]MCA9435579.1 cupin domain-containing protein [Candidatus Omnitrophota bacterium]